jgi:hypothetical protein
VIEHWRILVAQAATLFHRVASDLQAVSQIGQQVVAQIAKGGRWCRIEHTLNLSLDFRSGRVGHRIANYLQRKSVFTQSAQFALHTFQPTNYLFDCRYLLELRSASELGEFLRKSIVKQDTTNLANAP